MPAIKLKKAAAEHQAEKEREEREREAEMPGIAKPTKETKEVKEPKEAREPKEPKEAKDSALLRGLDANILFEKRKRQIVPSEQKVIDWIEANLEMKENSHVILQHLYDYFAEACAFDGTPVVSMDVFQRRVFDKFGKCFALKESSPYKGVIKERIGKGKGSKVKADSLKIKMKDIIEEGLKEGGNPAKGIRFNSLKQYIACNYPALRIDLRPGLLKVALNKGVAYGYIQQVKGIGMAGFYRLPVDEEPDEEEEEKAGEEKTEHQNGDSAEGGEKAEETKKKEEKKKSKKKKEVVKKEGEAKEEGEVKDVKEGETEEGKEGDDEEAKKKKKKKKHRKPRLDEYGAQPRRMEDIFPLAMTYMAEPKQASYLQMRKYIFEHYANVDENQLRKALVRGTNKGYWVPLNEKNVFSSRYDLLLDEFDPNSTDNVDDMICAAIIACSEPKQASSNLLKKYILEYHPEFNIESRPSLFKMALERGCKKGIILQITGIGASGSFQLCKVYKPSPVLLAGDEEEVEMDIFKGVKEEVYIPRGTKSRKLVPKMDASGDYRPQQKRKPPTNRNRPAKARSSSKSSRSSKSKAIKVESDDDDDKDDIIIEEEEEEEEVEPAPKKPKATPKKAKSTPKKSKAKKPAKKSSKPVSRSQIKEEEEDEEEVEVVKEEKPKKSRRSEVKEDPEEVKSGRGRSKSRPNYADDEGDSDDDEPKKSKGRKSSGSRRGSRVNYGEDEDVEEETTEYTPRKSKSRGGDVDESPSPKKSKKRR